MDDNNVSNLTETEDKNSIVSANEDIQDDSGKTDDQKTDNNTVSNPTGTEVKRSTVSTDNGNGDNSGKTDEQKSEFDKNRDFQNKLRKFKMSSSGKIAEYRKREAYDSPSVKRKKKSKEARRRNKKRSFSSSRRNGF